MVVADGAESVLQMDVLHERAWFNQDVSHVLPVGKVSKAKRGGLFWTVTSHLWGVRHIFASLPSLFLTGSEDDDHRGMHLCPVLAALPHLLHPAVFQP